MRPARLCLCLLLLTAVGCGEASKSATAARSSLLLSDIRPLADGGEGSRVKFTVENGEPITSTDTAGFRYQMVLKGMNFSNFSGSSEPTYWNIGAEHVYIGNFDFTDPRAKDFIVAGYKFESDPQYPLTMKLTKNGYLYLCGRGTITALDGKVHRLGQNDTVDNWLNILEAQNSVDREGAAQALGHLAKTTTDKEKAIPALIRVLRDTSSPVRRDAAEALGTIGSSQVIANLKPLTDEATEADEWVRAVAAEAISKIRARA